MAEKNQNPMKKISIEKLTLNIGVGAPGDKLDKAVKLLHKITGVKPIQTKSKDRIPAWQIRPGLAIGAKVTLRGKQAEEMLARLLKATKNKISARKFDKSGNFSFGIHEYLDIAGVEYDMDIGIIGLEAAITLQRPGFRVKKRRIQNHKIPKHHLITKEEAIEFIKNKFNITVEWQQVILEKFSSN